MAIKIGDNNKIENSNLVDGNNNNVGNSYNNVGNDYSNNVTGNNNNSVNGNGNNNNNNTNSEDKSFFAKHPIITGVIGSLIASAIWLAFTKL